MGETHAGVVPGELLEVQEREVLDRRGVAGGVNTESVRLDEVHVSQSLHGDVEGGAGRRGDVSATQNDGGEGRR